MTVQRQLKLPFFLGLPFFNSGQAADKVQCLSVWQTPHKPYLLKSDTALLCCTQSLVTSLIEAIEMQTTAFPPALPSEFPLLLSYQGQSEAELIINQQMLEQLLQQPLHLLPDGDRFIDCLGRVYLLDADHQLYATAEQLDLAGVISLIQQHFFALAQSCVIKIQAPDIRSALLLLAE